MSANKGFVFLVNLKKRTFKQIGETLNVNDDNCNEVLKDYCNKYIEELKSGDRIFLADDKLKAYYRASYSGDWDEEDREDDYPYYFDVAEHSERVMFYNILSGKEDVLYKDVKK